MKKYENIKLLEIDLYQPVRDYLIRQGYTVNSEVKDCDITAIKDDELIIVELKRSFNATLLIQAVKRQRIADSVYVAIPCPKGSRFTSGWRDMCHLLRRLELGLILVSFIGGKSDVEVVFHPSPFDIQKSRRSGKNKKYSIIQEIDGRHGDYNTGGSCKRKLVTAYRENSIHIACCLDMLGTLSTGRLRELGTGSKTQSILAKNFYQWFERVARGTYTLSQQGKGCLKDYPELTLYYNNEVLKKLAEEGD